MHRTFNVRIELKNGQIVEFDVKDAGIADADLAALVELSAYGYSPDDVSGTGIRSDNYRRQFAPKKTSAQRSAERRARRDAAAAADNESRHWEAIGRSAGDWGY